MMILVLRDDKHVANDITNTQYTDGKIGIGCKSRNDNINNI